MARSNLTTHRIQTKRCIAFIAFGNYCSCVSYNIYNATIVSADALYSVRKFSFCKIYTVFVGNRFYRLAHKRSHVLFVGKLQKLINFDEHTAGGHQENLSTMHKIRRTNVIEFNHWAEVANKTANINVQNKTAVYTPVNGVITHQKQQILNRWYFSAVH